MLAAESAENYIQDDDQCTYGDHRNVERHLRPSGHEKQKQKRRYGHEGEPTLFTRPARGVSFVSSRMDGLKPESRTTLAVPSARSVNTAPMMAKRYP